MRRFHWLVGVALIALTACQGESTSNQGGAAPPAAPGGMLEKSAPMAAPLAAETRAPVEPMALPPKAAPLPPLAAEKAPPASAELEVDAALAMRLTEGIDAHFSEAPLRGVHIQTDRPMYSPGDEVWVRAWNTRLAGLKTAPSEGLWFELVGPRGDVVSKLKVMRTPEGAFHHGLTLPAGASGGEYQVRVSTLDRVEVFERSVLVNAFEPPRIKKKLDFARKAYGAGDEVVADVVFERVTGEPLAQQILTVQVRVDGAFLPETTVTTDAEGKASARATLPTEIAVGDVMMSVKASDGGVVESITRRVPVVLKKLDFSLYPEGGDLVTGLPSRVYFEARKPTTGAPADVKGEIIDDQGAVVTTFESHRDGFGRFTISPESGRTYHAKITSPVGIDTPVALPPAMAEGCVLRSFDDLDGMTSALRVAVRCTEPQTVTVVAMQHGRSIDVAAAEASRDTPAVVYLESDDHALASAQGAARVTVFDAQQRPLAERLVYRNRRQRLEIEVTPSATQNQPRDQVTLEITTRTPGGAATPASLALSVVDDALISYADDRSGQLLSALLLEPELQGTLEEPNFYLDLSEKKSALALDLVMGARGWRRFDWAPIFEQEMPTSELVADATDTRPGSEEAEPEGPPPELLAKLAPPPAAAPPVAAAAPVEKVVEAKRPSAARRDPGDLKQEKEMRAGEEAREEEMADLPARDFNAGVGHGGGGRAGGMKRRSRRRKPRPLYSPIAVKQLFDAHEVEVLDCYRSARATHPGLHGQLSLSWQVDGSGRAQHLNASSDKLVESPLNKCVTSLVNGWDFPLETSISRSASSQLLWAHHTLVFDTVEGRPRLVDAQPEHWSVTWAPVRVFPAPDYSARDLKQAREDFRPTIHWAPIVETGEDGKATVSFYLSDAITSFRVQTEGVGGGYAGRDETLLASSRLFSASLKLPLEVSAGDQLLVPLTLTNATRSALPTTLEIDLGDALQANTALPTAVELAATTRESLWLSLAVQPAEGPTTLRLKADAGELSDALTRPLRVSRRGFPVRRTHSGMLATANTFTVELGEALPGSIHAELVIEPGVLATLNEAMKGMLREPGGCFEQTSSSNYPNALALSFLALSGRDDEALRTQALGYLDRGYARLIGFESPSHGFEWFGKDPGHLALTAYGLLEFTDMQRVFPKIDAVMVERTSKWLLERRDGKGGFASTSAQTLHTWDTGPVIDAYVTYSMTEAGYASQLTAEIDAQAALALKTTDPYQLALATATLYNVPERKAEAFAAAERLAGLQGEDGGWTGAASSATASRGVNLDVETTALAIAALIDSGAHPDAVSAGVAYLFGKRSGARFGATQATILAIKALLRYAELSAQGGGEEQVVIKINGEVVETLAVNAEGVAPLRFDLSEKLAGAGKSAVVTLEYAGDKEIPFSMVIDHRAAQPDDHAEGPVSVTTALSSASVAAGDSVRLTATVQNLTDEPLPMTMAIIGFPGGFTSQPWQLKDLKKEGTVTFYETNPREVIIYLNSMEAGERREIPIELSADIPGRYVGPASRGYLYYSDDMKRWAPPLEAEISP